MMTKVLYGQKKRENVSRILYDIWDHEDRPEPAQEWLFCLPVCHDQDHDGNCLHVCFACLYAMTKTTTKPVCMYFKFLKSTSIKDEDIEGNDKTRPQYVRRDDTKDTIEIYHCFTSWRESKQLSAWQKMLARVRRVHMNCDWWRINQHDELVLTVIMPCLAEPLFGELDLLTIDLHNNY